MKNIGNTLFAAIPIIIAVTAATVLQNLLTTGIGALPKWATSVVGGFSFGAIGSTIWANNKGSHYAARFFVFFMGASLACLAIGCLHFNPSTNPNLGALHRALAVVEVLPWFSLPSSFMAFVLPFLWVATNDAENPNTDGEQTC